MNSMFQRQLVIRDIDKILEKEKEREEELKMWQYVSDDINEVNKMLTDGWKIINISEGEKVNTYIDNVSCGFLGLEEGIQTSRIVTKAVYYTLEKNDELEKENE
jgi:hypothetical protein